MLKRKIKITPKTVFCIGSAFLLIVSVFILNQIVFAKNNAGNFKIKDIYIPRRLDKGLGFDRIKALTPPTLVFGQV